MYLRLIKPHNEERDSYCEVIEPNQWGNFLLAAVEKAKAIAEPFRGTNRNWLLLIRISNNLFPHKFPYRVMLFCDELDTEDPTGITLHIKTEFEEIDKDEFNLMTKKGTMYIFPY